jgi:HSP20 family protein
MNLIHYRPRREVSPWRPLFDLHTQIDRLFDDVLPGAPGAAGFVPAVDVFEKDDKIVVKADLPGIRKEDLEITVQDGTLTLRGKREKTEEVKEEGRYHFERSSGSFQRSIALPAEVDAEKIKAEFKDGVLTIEAPKSAAVLPHRVEISAN